MRVITNRSTGEMGRLIAAGFSSQGWGVTLLEGQAASTQIPLSRTITLKSFFYYDELSVLLAQELRRGYDAVIHAAAVSDFQLKKPFKGKISSGRVMRLDLVPTKKLVDRIKAAAPKSVLVGFKLETDLSRAFIMKKTKSLFTGAHCDFVLANKQVNGKYEACLIEPLGKMSPKVFNKKDIVKVLVKKIDERA